MARSIGKNPTNPSGKDIDALRRQVRRLETSDISPAAGPHVSLGLPQIDDVLPEGGLPLGRVHEITGNAVKEVRDATPFGFALALLSRLPMHGDILWCTRTAGRHGGALSGHGMRTLGLDPGRVLLVEAKSEADRLWVLEEALRCEGLTAAIVELDPLRGRMGPREQTAYRRLQLAAEKGGGLGLVIRPDSGNIVGGVPFETRWRVTAAPFSHEADWRPHWSLTLERARNGRQGQWRVVWDADRHAFELPVADKVSTSPRPVFGAPKLVSAA